MVSYSYFRKNYSLGGILFIPTLPLMVNTGVNPIIWYIVLGVCYSLSVVNILSLSNRSDTGSGQPLERLEESYLYQYYHCFYILVSILLSGMSCLVSATPCRS